MCSAPTPRCARPCPARAAPPGPLQMRKQAENLRYIMEAPRLEISPEERVQIPLLNHEDSWRRDA